MCGRLACSLNPQNLSCAASYKDSNSDCYVKAASLDCTNNSKPSFNIPPTASISVIVSSDQKDFGNIETTERIIVPMRFGIIPPWTKEQDFKQGSFETHLCRIERILDSKLYRPLLNKGNRCVIPCVGYYEWNESSKQPYFFYNKENAPSVLTLTEGSFDSENGWTGVQLLYLAGVFSSYTNKMGEKAYSAAIITKETEENWKWVHHRMPVSLQTENDVNMWLKSKTFSLDEAFKILKNNIENLAAHLVNRSVVNNPKNNSAKCIEEFKLNQPTNQFMKTWLGSNSKKENQTQKLETKSVKKDEPKKKRTVLDSWLTSTTKKPKQQ